MWFLCEQGFLLCHHGWSIACLCCITSRTIRECRKQTRKVTFKRKFVKPVIPGICSLKWIEYLPFLKKNLRSAISSSDLVSLFLLTPYLIVQVQFCMYPKQIMLRSTSKSLFPCLVIILFGEISTIFKMSCCR